MDRMLVVVFDNESKAYEGKKALLQLDGEGSMGVYGYAVLAKNAVDLHFHFSLGASGQLGHGGIRLLSRR